MKRTVIIGGLVLRGPATTGDFAEVDLLVEDGRIGRIGPGIPADGAEVIDARGTFVLPGFVDAHHHLWETAMRGITADWDISEFFWGVRVNHTPIHGPDDVYAGTYAGALSMLDAGTTTVADFMHAVGTPEHADEAVRAIKASGLRATWLYGLSDTGTTPQAFDGSGARLADARRVCAAHFLGDAVTERVSMGIAASEIGSVPWDTTRKEYGLARDLDVLLSAHTNSLRLPTPTPEIELLHRDGLLGDRQLHVHGNTSGERELRLLAETGAALVSTPETELQMGMDFPVFARAAASGVTVGIGTDIQANNSADAFAAMRLGMQAENARRNRGILDNSGIFGLSGVAVTARQMLGHATIGGARALGLGGVTGSLEPGKAADVILLRRDALHHRPMIDPFATIVLHSRPSDVDTVLVDGVVLKRGGALDEATAAEAGRLVDAASERVGARMAQRGGRKPPKPDDLLAQMAAGAAANMPEWATRPPARAARRADRDDERSQEDSG